MTVVHVSVGFTDPEDDAQLETRYLNGIIDLNVDRVHLSWYGDDAKPRILAVLDRLRAEVEALP